MFSTYAPSTHTELNLTQLFSLHSSSISTNSWNTSYFSYTDSKVFINFEATICNTMTNIYIYEYRYSKNSTLWHFGQTFQPGCYQELQLAQPEKGPAKKQSFELESKSWGCDELVGCFVASWGVKLIHPTMWASIANNSVYKYIYIYNILSICPYKYIDHLWAIGFNSWSNNRSRLENFRNLPRVKKPT